MISQSFLNGIDVLTSDIPAFLEGKKLGLLMNQASLSKNLELTCDIFEKFFPNQLCTLFSPEHGLWGIYQAGIKESIFHLHPQLNVPIYSLYSYTQRPTKEMLASIDIFIIDLQDVGTRAYTYIWTMYECLQACAESDISVLILDRPNPLGGTQIEGPLLDLRYKSFVGEHPIPMRHGLTMGELALLFNKELQLNLDLHIIPMKGWNRQFYFEDLGRCWIPSSPNLPTFQSLLVYSGQVLIEGTNLSEGRGTTTPFEIVGAPFIENPETMAHFLNNLSLPGVSFIPLRFCPIADKWAHEICGGVRLCITSNKTYKPYQTTLTLLRYVQQLWPTYFKWAGSDKKQDSLFIDYLTGSDHVRRSFETDVNYISFVSNDEVIENLCNLNHNVWLERIGPFLLY